MAASPVTVRVDAEKPIRTIPEDFCGLSYETKMVLANTNSGKHYFRGDNLPLITAFKTMGIKHLRVGGNTAERPTVNIPDEKDIDQLFAFAKATGLKVIYSVRLQKNTPEAAAKVAKYVSGKYGDLLSCFIGKSSGMCWFPLTSFLPPNSAPRLQPTGIPAGRGTWRGSRA
jgi:hypothetical protein